MVKPYNIRGFEKFLRTEIISSSPLNPVYPRITWWNTISAIYMIFMNVDSADLWLVFQVNSKFLVPSDPCVSYNPSNWDQFYIPVILQLSLRFFVILTSTQLFMWEEFHNTAIIMSCVYIPRCNWSLLLYLDNHEIRSFFTVTSISEIAREPPDTRDAQHKFLRPL